MKEIYKHQKSDPSPGDWCHLVDRDFEMIGEHLSDHQIEAMTPSNYEKYAKAKVYSDLEKPQEYLTSELFTNQ